MDKASGQVEVALDWVVRCSSTLQVSLRWSVSYVVILAVMYLFHSPFRAHHGTDWYSQVIKIFQIWVAIVLVFFHVGPLLMQRLSAISSSGGESMSAEDSIAAIFFPVFCFASLLFLYLHKIKRGYCLGVTYGPSFATILLNANLLAVFSLTHYTYCLWLWKGPHSWWLGSVKSLACPMRSVREFPLLTISHLLLLSLIFVYIDYRYKSYRGFDPSRGILWSELYDLRKVSGDWTTSGANTTRSHRFSWLRFWCRQQRLPIDYRSLEPKPTFVRATHHPRTGNTQLGESEVKNFSMISAAHPSLHTQLFAPTQPEAFPPAACLPPYSANHIDTDEFFELRPASLDQLTSMGLLAAFPTPAASRGVNSSDEKPLTFEPTTLEVEEVRRASHPINRPGMVPWWSTFVMSTTWQAAAWVALDFLAFDVRLLQSTVLPKIFNLCFVTSLGGRRRSIRSRDGQSCNPLAPPVVDSSTASVTIGRPDGDLCSMPAQPDVWFDWIADVGDGFNSTYEMARLLAQPVLKVDAAPLSRMPSEALPVTTTTTSRKTQEDSLSATTRRSHPAKAHGAERSFRRSASFVPSPDYSMSNELHASASLSTSTLFTGGDRIGDSFTGSAVNRSMRKAITTEFLGSTAASGGESVVLPRGSFVLVGGDLAYPNPSDDTYQTRLFEPYRDALRGNHKLRKLFHEQQRSIVVPDAEDKDVAHITMLDAQTVSRIALGGNVLRGSRGTAEEALRSAPMLFAIPGNHDWFDGLSTFRKFIMEKTWIGGWLMPQRSSYFVLRLPFNWFVLCGDTGTTADFDISQRNYFLDVIERHMDESSCVILACHEPAWIYEAMYSRDGSLQPEVNRVARALGTRLRLRICGDIHHYSRHAPCDALSEAPMLIVSGGGGAFLHGARRAPVISQGTEYVREAAFPQSNTYLSLASRLWGFRVINWKFDLFVGAFCFLVIFSLLPQPFMVPTMDQVDGLPSFVVAWIERTARLMDLIFSNGVCSPIAVGFFFIAFTAAGAENGFPLWLRCVHSGIWTFVVMLICTGMLAWMECIFSFLAVKGMLVSRGGHWGSYMEEQILSSTDAMVTHTRELLGAQSSVGLVMQVLQEYCHRAAITKWFGRFLRCLDPVETLAYLSAKVSSDTAGTFSTDVTRTMMVLYYLHLLFFYWVLVTPLVSVVIGSYLFVSATVFDSLYDAAYSAFQIEDFKSFVRFRIDARTRELHGYVVAEKVVPKVWELDPKHLAEMTDSKQQSLPPHLRVTPSRWCSVTRTEGCGAHLLEHFVCRPHRCQETSAEAE